MCRSDTPTEDAAHDALGRPPYGSMGAPVVVVTPGDFDNAEVERDESFVAPLLHEHLLRRLFWDARARHRAEVDHSPRTTV